MLKNYLKIALRNIQRNSVYSFINISGLSIGLACSMLILLWVHDEISYDRFQPKYRQLYQAWINGHYDGTINSFTSAPQPLAEALKSADANIIRTAKLDWGSEHLLTVGEKRLMIGGHYAGESFLEMFQFPLLKGSPDKVLNDPSSIVITENLAKSLFGDADPINQVIRVDNYGDVKVTGLLKDIPKTSSLQFQFLLPWSYYEQYAEWIKNTKDEWEEFSFQVFAELQPGTDEASVNKNVRDLIMKNATPDTQRDVFLYPMSRWRLYSSFKAGLEDGGMIDYVKGFATIGIFILIIACINFMNLATARSERRAREVGIRKSVGSRRSELILQFLGESMLIAVLAFILSLVVVEVSLPFYNTLVEKQLAVNYTSSLFWIFGTSVVFITGLVSGSYPAFYLSAFQPATVLKSKINVGKSASTPRKILVTLQFGFSILLITGTMVIHQQIEHIQNRSLGYDQENLMVVENTADLDKHFQTMKEEMISQGVAVSITKSQAPITSIFSNNFVDWPGKPEDQNVLFTTLRTEYDFTETMGIPLLEGRDFSPDFKGDSTAVLVNQAAIDIMGLKEPIGETLKIWEKPYTIIGITDNVLMGSVFRDVPPMFMVLLPDITGYISIRLARGNDLPASIGKVEEIVKKYNPAYPFEYTFADTQFAKMFSTINLISRLSNVFASLAILITCLGLFGLAAFTAEQRTKEIGIRKVLGASLTGIVLLISKDFSKLVLFAFAITAPLAWWVMDSFLQRYPYRIEIPLWILPLAGGVALLLALIIVTTQALRAARANPADSLRSE